MAKDNQPLSIKSRRRRNREEIIEDILQIAREMMQADGAASLSFNAIARRLGIKPPSLYTYFDSKHAIYDELFRRGFIEFQRQMNNRPNQDGAVYENMVSVFETYMRFAQENLDLYQIMFQRPVPDFIPSEASMAISLSALKDSDEDFQRLINNGDINPDLPIEQAKDILIAMMHGLTEQHMANNPELPVGEGRYGGLIHQAVTVILKAWSVKK